MAVFNKILNVLILVLAGTAVAFGFMLFEKRVQLKDRGDKMAKVIRSVAKTLDEESGTDIADKLRLTKSAPSNTSLYHDNFKNLGKVLGAFETQASDIIQQRNALSKTLFKVAETLKLPDSNSFASIQFQNIEKYPKKGTDLITLVGKVEKRDSEIAAKVATIAGQVDCTIDPNALKSLDGYSAPLTDFSDKVKAVKDKSDTFASHVKAVCSAWDVSEPALDGDDYADVLSSVASSLKSKKDEFDQTKTELANQKEKVTELNDKLTQKLDVIKSNEGEIKKLKGRLAQYEGDGDKPGNDQPAMPKSDMDLVKMLKGEVTNVNKKWGFVMINLGKDNKLIIGNVKKVEKSVALPEGQVMTVARGDKFVGQIKIVKVDNDCSIADMVGDSTTEAIRKGDTVYFAREIKTTKKSDDDSADDESSDDDTDKTADEDSEDSEDSADDEE